VATALTRSLGLGFLAAGLALLDTSVGTPWKQSLYAVAAILVALALYGIA